MQGFAKLLAGSAALAAVSLTTPAIAQYYPATPYGAPAGPFYGYGPYGARVDSRTAIGHCVAATQARLNGRYQDYRGEFVPSLGRVMGISGVQPRAGGGLTVRGVARTIDYLPYGYHSNGPNLVWTCRTDFRGLVTGLRIEGARPNIRYDYRPFDNDYSQYGYQRY